MIDERLIRREILKRIIDSGEFDNTDIAYDNHTFASSSLAIWMQFNMDIVPETEIRMSNTVISASYMATMKVYVPVNTGTQDLNIKKKALLDLFDPRKAVNEYFLIDGAKVDISQAESLRKVPFETAWFQGGIQIIINANQI